MLFRWMVRLTVLVLTAILCAGTLIYYLAAQSLPNYAQNLQFSQAQGSIEIIRDTANVPHIEAENDHDIFFALGFVHAQDRLWHMAMLRRTAQGRLSEVFGARSLETDKLMRRLDLYSYAADSLQYQTAQAQAALSAYAAGVNARIEHINRAALGRGAPEMFLFDSPFAAWQPIDSLALLKLIGFQQSGHLKEEILRAQVSLILEDNDHVEEILPDTPFHIGAKPRSYLLFLPLLYCQQGSAPQTARMIGRQFRIGYSQNAALQGPPTRLQPLQAALQTKAHCWRMTHMARYPFPGSGI